MIGFGVILGGAILATVGVALGGHIYAWEFYVWVWGCALWAGIAAKRADR